MLHNEDTAVDTLAGPEEGGTTLTTRARATTRARSSRPSSSSSPYRMHASRRTGGGISRASASRLGGGGASKQAQKKRLPMVTSE
jgi:hypothetical protein